MFHNYRVRFYIKVVVLLSPGFWLLNLELQILNESLITKLLVFFNPQPSTLNPQPSTLNPQPSTLNPQPSTLNLSLVAGREALAKADEL